MKLIFTFLLLSMLLLPADNKVEPQLTEQEYKELINKLGADSSKIRKEARKNVEKLNKADRKAILKLLKSSQDPELTELAKEIKTAPQPHDGNWITTKSGLKYKILKKGGGPKPKIKSKVTVHYEGKLPGGNVFDSSIKRGQPATFPLNAVIKGWTEGLQLMSTGAEYVFKIPPELAYGKNGAGGMIPPNSTLIFKVQLISFN